MTFRRFLHCCRRFLPLFILLGALSQLSAATFVVTNTADSGIGSLRTAIMTANSSFGPDTITFNISAAGAQTISLLSNLPGLTETATIDGTTQPGYASKPLIALRGNGAFYGLQLQAPGCVVRGLAIGNFSSVGIYILSSSNLIEKCYVGTDATGMFSRPNGIGILLAFGSSYNGIGGSNAGNVISGNSDLGLCLNYSSWNVVQGNFIGTDITGTNSLGNVNDGISIDHAPNNQIGGTGPGEGNLISGNRRDGIRFIASSANNNVIEGNIVGLDLTGGLPLGNAGNGINVADGMENTIGGTEAGSRNIVSGNSGDGIALAGQANVIQGNLIGLDIVGRNGIPNAGNGISISGATENTIGGTEPGGGNVISGNGGAGISLGGSNNVVQANLIGTDAAASVAVPNGIGALPSSFSGSGVLVLNASNQTIGGDIPAARNIIAGNKYSGVALVSAQGCVVQGNWLGIGAAGQALANGGAGLILSDSAANTIGGAIAGEGNVCSGNSGYGMVLQGSGTTSNLVVGNYVGMAPNGRDPRGNVAGGIAFGSGASANGIGSSENGDANIISANRGPGVLFGAIGANPGASPSVNFLQGNRIGLDVTGNPAPNFGPGIDVAAPVNWLQIGGSSPGEGNGIAYNMGGGVLVRNAFAFGVTISGNLIYGNDALGINLQPAREASNTVTANDASDADSGPNRLQNFPVITNTVYAGGVTVISGYLRSLTNEDFDIEIFANDFYAHNGYGEGQRYLGTADCATDDTGFGEFQFVVPGSFGSQVFTATATRFTTGDTSEFSRALPTLQGLLRITEVRKSGADVQISFTTKTGTNYRVEVTAKLENPSSWSTVSGASNVAGTGSVVSVTDSGMASAGQRFYRIIQL